MYSTAQEIEISEHFDKDAIPEPMKIIFQPSKDEPKEYFDSFEAADKRAESYWIENFTKLKTELGLNFEMNED